MKRLASALFVVLTVAAQPPKDVAGWGKVKWGMTVAEAKAALGNEAHPEGVGDPRDLYATRLRLENIQIGGVYGTARIQTKQNSDIVCAVGLVPTFSSTTAPIQDRQAAALFEDLKQMLIEKYGQPKTSDKKADPFSLFSEGVETTAFWSFPSTSITLTGTHSAKYHSGDVSIFYEAVDKKALGTL